MTSSPTDAHSARNARFHLLLIFGLWLVLFFAALFQPPVLDDADGTHAQAARAMLTTGDWVTLHVDGVRYLEKAPLPYWAAAVSFAIFGFNAFAAHVPIALGVLGLALLTYAWSRRAFGEEVALLSAAMTLTSVGVFLFTRILIPEALLSFFLLLALLAFLCALHEEPGTTATRHLQKLSPYILWTALALAVLAKGLVAIVFIFVPCVAFLFISGNVHEWRRLRPVSGMLLLLVVAAPWHILASLRNTGGAQGHGFFWFYFINEHVLRFLGRRIPRDYNRLPWFFYWSLHGVWLLPWSFFAPLVLVRKNSLQRLHSLLSRQDLAARSILLLLLYSATVLVFFSLSTNQEYYTFPAFAPMLMLIAWGIIRAQQHFRESRQVRRWFYTCHAAFTIAGVAVTIALACGLWSARGIHSNADIGSLLAHRGVGQYTLSMSHFFDLTGPSFAALRLPATLALITFAAGPSIAFWLRVKQRHTAASAAVALTSAAFLIAAHIALVRFAPLLSSKGFADTISQLNATERTGPNTQFLIFGDQTYGSSIPFYLGRPEIIVDGRETSMIFGSTFPDAPPVFITSKQLLSEWGNGPRKLLFVPAENRADAERLLGPHAILLEEISGKALFTDRALNAPSRPMHDSND